MIAEPKIEHNLLNRFRNIIHKVDPYIDMNSKVNCWWDKSEYEAIREKTILSRSQKKEPKTFKKTERSVFDSLTSYPKRDDEYSMVGGRDRPMSSLMKDRPRSSVSKSSDITSALFSGKVDFKADNRVKAKDNLDWKKLRLESGRTLRLNSRNEIYAVATYNTKGHGLILT
jgi:hypothetical protein